MSLPSLSGHLCCRFLPYIHPTWRYGRDDVPNAQNLKKVNQPLAELTNHQHLLPYPIILCSNKHLRHNPIMSWQWHSYLGNLDYRVRLRIEIDKILSIKCQFWSKQSSEALTMTTTIQTCQVVNRKLKKCQAILGTMLNAA
jgi:hypothetical protein